MNSSTSRLRTRVVPLGLLTVTALVVTAGGGGTTTTASTSSTTQTSATTSATTSSTTGTDSAEAPSESSLVVPTGDTVKVTLITKDSINPSSWRCRKVRRRPRMRTTST